MTTSAATSATMPRCEASPEDLGITMAGGIRVASFSGRQVFFSAVDGTSALAVSVIENYLPRK